MIIDFCAYLGTWPLYPLPIRDAATLVERMDRCGIAVAFVSNVEGLLLLDPQEANERLVRMVEGHRNRLLPVGTANPTLGSCQADVREAVERWNLAGFRLSPNYHGYAFDSDVAVGLANLLAEYQRPLFVAASVDEERFQHPALRVSPVPVASMVELIRHAPRTVIVLNNLFVEEALSILQQPGLPLDNVLMDVTAMDKPFDGLAQVLRHSGSAHLVYGSQAPFLYPEATLALIQENRFAETDVRAILAGNGSRHPTLARWIQSGHSYPVVAA